MALCAVRCLLYPTDATQLLCYEFHVRTAALCGKRCDQVEGWQVSLPLHWYLNELMGKESLEESFQLMLEDEYHPFAPSH